MNGTPISDHIALAAGDQLTLADVELELVDPKQEPVVNEKAPRSEWSISSRASWLEQPRFQINSKVIIGRDPSCDIVLPLEHLSRQHVCLELRNGQLFARDLGSANGTWVNGHRTSRSVLGPGDRIALGRTVFEIQFEADEDEVPTLDGSAEARQTWFLKGYNTGDPEACDTLSVSAEEVGL